ncbi:glutamate racemase [Seonamhaeicola sp. MEBiC1930]|uniref:glutamate racemase n=1 Tax=Seonamhaeicola sp. MEBiC01930 TaxID=2976768 RepID=UPI00324F9C7C
MTDKSIGIFDSGVGGTSIWKEIHLLLPYENTIYLSDSLNAPYGPKGKKAITELCIKNTELLLEKDCKIIVIACNTATTNAIDYLRENYKVPFIGIEPAIKPAALQTKTNAVGILATKGTLTSELFSKTSGKFASNINVVEQVGEGIVQLIESGKLYSGEMTNLLKTYLKPMQDANIDYLVLGCSHYPYLIPQLTALLPEHVKIIDSGEAVAKQTKVVLKQNDLLSTSSIKPKNIFYTNGQPELLNKILEDDVVTSYLNF